MAEPTEPKKETVRIAVPPPQPAKAGEGRDTVRITLPTRPPVSAPLPPANPPREGAPRPPMARTLVPPAPSKPVQAPRFIPPPPGASPSQSNAPASSAAPAPAPATPSATSLKKETARITVLPDPVKTAGPAVQMKKTQPLIDMPASSAPAAPIMTTAASEAGPSPSTGDSPVFEEVPGVFYWALLGVSAVVLIIQILNYIS